jgi:hypothetical protein
MRKPSAAQLGRLVERVKVVVGANVDDMAVRRALIMARFDVQNAIVRFFDGSFDVAAARPAGVVGEKRKRNAPAAAAAAPSMVADDAVVPISPRRAALVTTPLTIAWGLACGQPACKGRGLLAVNDVVQCWRDGPKSRFVRFGRDRARAIGSLGRDVAFLAVLLDAGAITVDGVCQSCPPELTLLSTVSIMLRVDVVPGGQLRGSVFDADATGHPPALRAAAFALLAWLFPAVALSLNAAAAASRERSGGGESSSGASPDVVDLVLHDGDAHAAGAGAGARPAAAAADEDDGVAPPAALLATLWPHQLVAMRWMLRRERNAYACGANSEAAEGDERAPTAPAAGARDGEDVGNGGGAVADLLRQNPLWIRCALAQAGAGALYANPYSRATRIAPPRQPAACRGGILADDMGMGKTICVLALVLADKARLRISLRSGEEGARGSGSGARAPSPFAAAMRACGKHRAPTLIVVPMTCLGQWVEEFKKHSKRGALVIKPYYGGASFSLDAVLLLRLTALDAHATRYNAASRCNSAMQQRDATARRNNVMRQRGATLTCSLSRLGFPASFPPRSGARNDDELRCADVIVTTFGVVGAEMPEEAGAAEGKGKGGAAGERAGGLFAVQWRRVVLDEAHTIKNRATVAHRACCRLDAPRRWAVTGTPMQNSIEDIASLLKFLRHQPWDERLWWEKVIGRPYERGDGDALPRLKAVLQPIMLRRRKESLGVPRALPAAAARGGVASANGGPADGARGGSGGAEDGGGAAAEKSALRSGVVRRDAAAFAARRTRVRTVDFTVAERTFYNGLFTQSKTEFEGFATAGSIMANFAAILVLLLRLRQVSVLLSTVTYYANRAHNLTRSP